MKPLARIRISKPDKRLAEFYMRARVAGFRVEDAQLLTLGAAIGAGCDVEVQPWPGTPDFLDLIESRCYPTEDDQ